MHGMFHMCKTQQPHNTCMSGEALVHLVYFFPHINGALSLSPSLHINYYFFKKFIYQEGRFSFDHVIISCVFELLPLLFSRDQNS